MKNSNFKRIVLILVTLTIAFSLAACACDGCGGGSGTFNVVGSDGYYSQPIQDEFTIEFGESFRIPTVMYNGNTETTYTVTDANGNPITAQYGMLRPSKAGVYTITFVSGSASKEVRVNCNDTVAPNLTIQSYAADGIVGEDVAVPYFTATDRADIDNTRTTIKVTDPNGADVAVNGGFFTLAERGHYTVVVTVYDKNGLSASQTLKVRSALRFVDENINENVLFDFNEADYAELMFDVAAKKEATREVVYDDPTTEAVEDMTSGNGFMKIYAPSTSDGRLSDVYTRVRLNTGWYAGQVKASKIKIKFAVSTPTDYVKIKTDDYTNTRINDLDANVWYTLELDPVDFGYYREFTDFNLVFRNKNDTVLYIDEITYENPVFIDENISEYSLGDFDEAGYENISYQNVYCDPTTSRAYRVDGTTFEYLTADQAPAANSTEDGTLYPGMGANGGVLKVTTAYDFGGMSYIFPEVVNLNEINSLTFKLFLEGANRSYIFGFFNGQGLDLGNTSWFTFGDGSPSDVLVEGQWLEISFDSHYLKSFSNTDEISGFFLQSMVDRELPLDNYDNENNQLIENIVKRTFYIDDIVITKNAGESSELSSDTITKFATDANMANVIKPIREIGYLSTATLEHEAAGVFGSADGVLKVTSNYKKYVNFTKVANVANVYGDGFIYVFDQPIGAEDIEMLTIKYAFQLDHQIESINYYLVSDNQYIRLGNMNVGNVAGETWHNLGISSADIYGTVGNSKISGIAFIIRTRQDSANNVFYIDDMTLYDTTADVTAPTATFSTIELDIVEGDSIGTEFISAEITDDLDPMPFFELRGLIDPDGVRSEAEGDRVTPVVSGEHKYVIVAVDHAGNESEEYEVPVTINVKDEYNYNYLNFGPSANAILKDYEDNRTTSNDGPNDPIIERRESQFGIVVDPAASDGFAAHITLDMSSGGNVCGTSIVMKNPRKLEDVRKISIRLRVINSSGGNWVRIKFNEYASTKGANTIHSFAVDNYKGSEYFTVEYSGEKIEEFLSRSDIEIGENKLLETISIVAEDNGSLTEMYIDSIDVAYENEMVNITYDYNGGTDGVTSNTSVTYPYMIGDTVRDVFNITNGNKIFLGWTEDLTSYELYDITAPVANTTTLYAVWYDPAYLNFADTASKWIVNHHRPAGWDNITSEKDPISADWSDDGWSTGLLHICDMPSTESHSYLEIILPNVDVSTLKYFAVKLYSDKDETLYFNLNEREIRDDSYVNSVNVSVKKGLNTVKFTVGTLDSYINVKSFGDKLTKLYISTGRADVKVMLDGVYFIEEGSDKALYTESYYFENDEGGYDENVSMRNEVVGTIGSTVANKNRLVEGYDFEEANTSNNLSGTVLEDGSLVLNRYYKAHRFDVTFDANGGSFDGGLTSIEAERIYNGRVNGPVATKEGLHHIGWTTDPASSDLYIDRVYGELTLYAVYGDLSWYDFSSENSAKLVTYVKASNDIGSANLAPTNASWAIDGKATGNIYIGGAADQWFHTYVRIALPMLDTESVEKVVVRFTTDNSHDMWFSFNEKSYYTTGNYPDAYRVRLARGVNEIAIPLSYLENCGEYANSLYMYTHWVEHNVQIDYVGFVANVSNMASYSETYYLETPDHSFVIDEDRTVTNYAIIGASLAAKEVEIEGYTFDSDNENNKLSGTVLADGSLVFARYYTANTLNVTYDFNGGALAGEAGETKAVTQLAGTKAGDGITGRPTKTGYVFGGWAEAEGSMINKVGKLTTDTTLYAIWIDISLYEFSNTDVYGLLDYVNKNTNVVSSTAVTESDWATDGYSTGRFYLGGVPSQWFHTYLNITLPYMDTDSIQAVVIRFTAENSNNIYACFNGKGEFTNTGAYSGSYSITPTPGVNEVVIPASYFTNNASLLGDVIHSLTLATGYNGNYLQIDAIGFVTDEIVTHATYTVEHWVVEDGQSPAERVDLRDTFYGAIGGRVNASAKSILGFQVDTDYTGTVSSAIVNEDGSTVLKLYYTVKYGDVTFDYNGGKDASNNTSTTENVRVGGAPISGEGITKDGAWFYGWSTTPYVNKASDVAANETYAPSLDVIDVVEADATYYAVWYYPEWLEFGNATTNGLVITNRTKTGTSETTDKVVDSTNPETSDGKMSGSLRLWQPITHNNTHWIEIKLPRVATTSIEYLKINLVRNSPVDDSHSFNATAFLAYVDDINTESKSSGAVSENVWTSITMDSSFFTEAKYGATVEKLYISIGAYQDLVENYIDSIELKLNDENDLITTYTKSYYKIDAEQNITEVESLRETCTAYVGMTVSATPKTFTGLEFDADNENNVTSAVVEAGGATTLKFYYDAVKAAITYDYNGGVDGANNTSTTELQYTGDALIDGSALTKDGAWFMGWSATKYVNDVDEVEEGATYAPSLETVDTIGGSNTTYYAVWYEAEWLEFGNATSNAQIIKNYAKASGNNQLTAYTPVASTNPATNDGLTTPGLHIWQPITHNASYWVEILLPNLPTTSIESVTVNFMRTSTSNTPLLMAFDDATDQTVSSSTYSTGTWSSVTADASFFTTAKYGDTVEKLVLTIGAYHDVTGLFLDNVVVKLTSGDQLTTYTKSYYVQNEDGGYDEDESLRETVTAYKGMTATPVVKSVVGAVYDVTVDGNTPSGIVSADGSTVLKFYYSKTEVGVNYDFNGGTDGTSATSKLHNQMGGSALVDDSELNLTREGYIFAGWNTSANDEGVLTTTDALATNGATFYAVWYKESWLSLNDATTNAIVFAGSAFQKGTSNDTIIGDMAPVVNTTESTDGYLTGEFYLYGANSMNWEWSWVVINLPNVKVSEIESITVNVYRTNNNRTFVSVNNHDGAWTQDSGFGSTVKIIDNNAGVYAVTITAAELTAKGIDTVSSLWFDGNWSHSTTSFDNVVINWKTAE